MKRSFFLFIFFIFCYSNTVKAQCVVINEAMINAFGACDGACVPNTAEWEELYNTCNTPVDISCWVLTDGEYTVTIPAGTIMPPNSYYVIGSNNSGVAINLNIGTCNCTGGANIGVLSNGGEQLVLTNNTGTVQDQMVWGAGDFPFNINSIALAGCNSVNIAAANATGFEVVPVAGQGCGVARDCDGSLTWEVRCLPTNITPGATNGTPTVPDFTASNTTICTGSCIDFTDISSGTPTAWTWTFPGAATANSNSQNPTNICYNTVGVYDVTLQVTNFCGTFSATQTALINVTNSITATISAGGAVNFCPGNSVTLTCNETGTYQWLLNGAAIPGETNSTLVVTAAGNYSVELTSGTCFGTSNIITTTLDPAPLAIITPQGATAICNGSNVILDGNAGMATYQWQLNGVDISSATTASYTASASGNYTLITSNGSCSATSAPTAISNFTSAPPVITSTTGAYDFCAGSNITLNIPATYTNIQWQLNGTNILNATNVTYLANQGGAYTVSANDANGCNSTSVIVNVVEHPIPIATINPAPQVIICNGNSTTLTSSNAISYQWLLNGVPIANAPNAATLPVSTNGTYQVNITDAFGCTAQSAGTQVSFNASISVNIIPSNTNPCEGETVYLTTDIVFPQMEWSNGQSGTEIAVTVTDTYTVTVIDNNNCHTSDAIAINFNPKPYVDAGPEQQSDCVKGAVLLATGSGSYLWSPAASLSSNSVLQPVANPTKNTTYILTVSDGICTAQDSVTVSVKCSSIYVPSSFTPNNDTRNDVFNAIGYGINKFKLSIFNRWGEKVFETTSFDEGWDGTYKGNEAPTSTYVWFLEAFDSNDQPMLNSNQSNGIVTIYR